MLFSENRHLLRFNGSGVKNVMALISDMRCPKECYTTSEQHILLYTEVWMPMINTRDNTKVWFTGTLDCCLFL